MNAKKTLERLRADPKLRARDIDGDVFRVKDGKIQFHWGAERPTRWIDWLSGNSLGSKSGWKLVRRVRNVFRNPQVGDRVTDLCNRPAEIRPCTVKGFDYVDIIPDQTRPLGYALSKAEFAARAGAPWHWGVLSRAR